MKKSMLLRWFVIFFSIITTMGIMHFKSLFAALWVADISGLSFLTIGVFLLITSFIGVITYKLSKYNKGDPEFNENMKYIDGCWYASELLMAFGMMGTLIGFTVMLGPAITAIDPSNISAAKTAIFSMAGGMSTAVLATLAGLITSQLVKLQLINIEMSLPEVDDVEEE